MSAIALPNPLASRDHRLGLLSLVAATCAINILSLALPIATLQVYDRVLHGQNVGTLELLAFGVVVAILTETALRLMRSYLVSFRGAAYAHSLSCSAINSQISSRGAASDNRSVASDLASINAIKNLKEFRSGAALINWIDLAFVPIFLAVIAHIAGKLVLVPLALLCAYAIITAISGLKVRGQLEKSAEVDERRYDFLIESLSSSRLLKSMALERLLQRRFERLQSDSCHASYKMSKAITTSFVTGTVVGHFMTLSTVSAGAYMAVNEWITVGALITAVQLSNRLMQPVQKAVLLWLRYQDYQSARLKVERLFDVPEAPVVERVKPPFNSGRLNVSALAYRTHEGSPLLFDDVNLTLQSGEALILDGRTGSGKTTLLKLIANIYVPASGKIRINGVDPNALAPIELARQVGYMSPRSTLFRGTIRDNITRFNNVPVSQALSVAKLLGLSDEFERLPLGIDTPVGREDDTPMSPGLAQMITILRVLAPRPKLILYDNADAGLDPQYYNKIYSLLTKLKSRATFIIVSRDLNIRELGTRNATLIEGRLVENDLRRPILVSPEARL